MRRHPWLKPSSVVGFFTVVSALGASMLSLGGAMIARGPKNSECGGDFEIGLEMFRLAPFPLTFSVAGLALLAILKAPSKTAGLFFALSAIAWLVAGEILPQAA